MGLKQQIFDAVMAANAACDICDSGGRLTRLKIFLPTVLKLYPGNLIEIGCGAGHTTDVMCYCAKNVGSKVLGIDPWNGDEGGTEKTYKSFCESMQCHCGCLTVHREQSFAMSSHNIVSQFAPISFGYVDGHHTYDDAVNDLHILADNGCAVICVDDREIKGVKKAIYEFEANFVHCGRYELIPTRADAMEIYYVRGDI